MYCKLINCDDIKIDEFIDNSYNGKCFAYSWFLALKDVKKIIAIYHNDDLIGFMPAFVDGECLSQSTIYIPYGGFVIKELPALERSKVKLIRTIETTLAIFLKENYKKISFSLDDKIIDIMPFIRNGFIPEVRYTYKLDLCENLETIYNNFGSDRKKEIRKNKRAGIVVRPVASEFDVDRALKWESNYNSNSKQFVENYISKSIEKQRGMSFVAISDNQNVGGVHIVWDVETAYIMYSYYEPGYDVIASLYYEIISYLKTQTDVKYLDFEGSVFETIEDWNISFNAYQSRFYNLHWDQANEGIYYLYNYGDK